ncbi:hypothetical protein PG997_013629 [Apiospora hydei]|uniref:Cytochrome P450 n=1 Tax=Apiospora hydei TaxID=1337664 RepID=A0ABR1V6Q5_9PEZI
MHHALLLAALVLAAVLLFIVVHEVLLPSHDPREPPLVQPKIPLIGHSIELLRIGTQYYSKLAQECKQPIFALHMPRAKMYVVTSPSLVAVCDRRSRAVSFVPYVLEFAKRILLTSPHGMEMLSEDIHEESRSGLRPETLKVIHKSLMPGDSLEAMAKDTVEQVSAFLESPVGLGDEKGVPLFLWVREFFSIASTNVMYGPENPLLDPELMDGFWTIDKDFALLGLDIKSHLVAPKASRGRQDFFAAFRRYYATGGFRKASQLVQNRYEANRKRGVSADDIAQFDLGVCIGLLVNSVPAICWTLCHVYSDPNLLITLREGIEKVITSNDHSPENASADDKGPTTTVVNIPQLIQDLPLLESLVKEVLRVQSNNASARFLLEDTSIQADDGSTYLLKKDAFLVVPSAPIHNSEDVWGPTAREFDPMRFLRPQGHKGSGATYRTFGGGQRALSGAVPRRVRNHQYLDHHAVEVRRRASGGAVEHTADETSYLDEYFDTGEGYLGQDAA